MRTPQAQIERSSTSTITTNDGTFFQPNHSFSNEPGQESEINLENNIQESQSNDPQSEAIELRVGVEDFINDLESRSANLPTEEEVFQNERTTDEIRQQSRVPDSITELQALQEGPISPAPVAELRTSNMSDMADSLGSLSPMEMGRTAPQFNDALQSSITNEINTLQSELPVLDQPTGLEPGQGRLRIQPVMPITREAVVEANQDQSKIQTTLEPTPEPEPAQVRTSIPHPTNENELEQALAELEIDTEVNTDLGPRPQIDLTGQADPGQPEREQTRNSNIMIDGQTSEINEFRRDFGENDIYPSIPTSELSSSHELTPPEETPRLDTELQAPILLESDEILLNEDIIEELGDERNRVLTENREASEQFEAERTSNLKSTLETIRNEEQLSTNEQIRAREQNAETINGYRAEHQVESQNIMDSYQEDVNTERELHDSTFGEELDSSMSEIETVFDETEGAATERETKAAERVAEKRRKAEKEKNEQSWLGAAISAVKDFFNKLIKAVTELINDLRSWIKKKFDEIKAWAIRTVNRVRNLLVGLIRKFGEKLKQLSNWALQRFPVLRDRVNGLIDQSMDWAERKVNQIADSLKRTVVAALDALAQAIDSVLATFQTVVVAALGFLRDLTVKVLEIADAFLNYLITTILQIATLIAFVAIMLAGQIFLTFAWHFIGRRMKERVVNMMLDLVIWLFESAPDDFNHGWIWPLFVNMQLGYFYEMRDWEMETKIAFFDKIAGLLISPSFWWNFLKGIFIGIWDNLWGIIEGIWMLIRFIFHDMWVLIARVVKVLRDLAPDIVALIEQLNIDIRKFIIQLKTEGKAGLNRIRQNLSKENIERFFENIGDEMRTRAQTLGGRMAEKFRDFILRDDAYAAIGMAVGRVTGYLIVEILLLFFTAGIGTAIKWGLKGIKVAVQFAKILGNVGRAGGMFSRIIRFFAKGAKWLMRAIVKFAEKVAQLARGLLQKFKTIFTNLSRRIDNIVAKLTGRRPTPRPRLDVPNRPPRRPGRDNRNRQQRRSDQRRWLLFRTAVRSRFQRHQNDGITVTRARTELTAVVRSHGRIARVPVNVVDRDKGWLKISAVKRRTTVNRKRQVARVPVAKIQRWQLAKTAIRARLNRIRENQINRRGIRGILRREHFRRDYKFSRLYPEWDEQESDWNIMGAMSEPDELAEVKDFSELHTGSSSDPIPLKWYKRPQDYPPSITLEINGQMETINMFSQRYIYWRRIQRDDLTRFRVGVSRRNEMRRGRILRLPNNYSRIQTTQRVFRRMLKEKGYTRFLRRSNPATKDVDHVRDLRWGGVDEFHNMWPLIATVNQRPWRRPNWYEQYHIEYKEREAGNLRKKQDTLGRLRGKWFVITGYVYPPPNPGGRT